MERTRFTGLAADDIKALLTGTVLTLSDDHTLSEDERAAYIGATLSAASKTLTLDLPDGAVCLVVNEGGTNAFTIKNVALDTGTSLAAGKVALVRASTETDGSIVKVLN